MTTLAALSTFVVIASVARPSTLDQTGTTEQNDVSLTVDRPSTSTGSSGRLGEERSLAAISLSIDGAPDALARVIRVATSVDCSLDEWHIMVVPIVEESSEAITIDLAESVDGQELCWGDVPAVLTVDLAHPYNGRPLTRR